MRELNNVPEGVLDFFLKDKEAEITSRLPEYIDKFFLTAVAGYIGTSVYRFIERLRKYHKIQIIKDLYTNVQIGQIAAEYLYSGYGPIVILQRKLPDNIIPLLNERYLINLIKEKYKLTDYKDTIRIPLRKNGCEFPIKRECCELQVVKVKEMTEKKFLIQLSFLEKYNIVVSNRLELIEIPQVKIINCVLDISRELLQLRASYRWARYCILFFKKIFDPEPFVEINIDKMLIEQLEIRLTGNTYEYIGKRKNKIKEREVIDDLISGKVKVSEHPFIIEKTLKKYWRIPFDIRCSPDFSHETVDYPLKSDLFDFEPPDEMTSVEEIMKIEISVDRSYIYFRRFATESIIDYVLDNLLAARINIAAGKILPRKVIPVGVRRMELEDGEKALIKIGAR